MTARLIFVLIIIAASFALGTIPGHYFGRRSRRFDRREGYREGVCAEAARWEKVTGVPFDRLQAWRTGRGPDPFASAPTEVLPSFRKVMADADAALLSAAEADEWKARWDAAQHRAPVVASITDAAGWRRPGAGHVPVIDGKVVTPPRDPSGGWDAAAALPDYAAAALGGHRTVDECVDSIVMRAVKP